MHVVVFHVSMLDFVNLLNRRLASEYDTFFVIAVDACSCSVFPSVMAMTCLFAK